ncbi:hypothetical protein OS493_002590 [Desmophyllum pertusum]|uniref:Bcl-2 Bcl-2 homology region 1-3 domain-containing protein n=1 Tax=Desmophyllum pertusum TaxID=174260 RepID=A0A9W9YTA8_9CNID|nr:hypothetical protein OS493_002590 [Desmophyllum pertusum]
MESRLKLPKVEGSPIAQEATVLANDFISYRLGNSPIPVSPTAATLRKLADQIEEQYPLLLNHLCHKLNITPATVYQTFFEIASEVFADGINWGRIVALFAFGGKLAVYCDQHHMKELVALVTDWVGRYVGGLCEWIENHGGWDGLDKQFSDKGQDGAWWKGVFLTTLGLGTLAAFMYSR